MKREQVMWLIGSLAAALVVIAGLIGIRLFVIAPYRIPTGSMMPTIRPGEIVFGYKLAYLSPASVHRGDIMFYRAHLQGQTSVYMKRVIGLPGDRVRTSGFHVVVNDVELPERPVGEDGPLSVFEETLERHRYDIGAQVSPPPRYDPPTVDVTVPPDAFFVVGDNRTNSFDSRYAGCVAWKDVMGRILAHDGPRP